MGRDALDADLVSVVHHDLPNCRGAERRARHLGRGGRGARGFRPRAVVEEHLARDFSEALGVVPGEKLLERSTIRPLRVGTENGALHCLQ